MSPPQSSSQAATLCWPRATPKAHLWIYLHLLISYISLSIDTHWEKGIWAHLHLLLTSGIKGLTLTLRELISLYIDKSISLSLPIYLSTDTCMTIYKSIYIYIMGTPQSSTLAALPCLLRATPRAHIYTSMSICLYLSISFVLWTHFWIKKYGAHLNFLLSQRRLVCCERLRELAPVPLLELLVGPAARTLQRMTQFRVNTYLSLSLSIYIYIYLYIYIYIYIYIYVYIYTYIYIYIYI